MMTAARFREQAVLKRRHIRKLQRKLYGMEMQTGQEISLSDSIRSLWQRTYGTAVRVGKKIFLLGSIRRQRQNMNRLFTWRMQMPCQWNRGRCLFRKRRDRECIRIWLPK